MIYPSIPRFRLAIAIVALAIMIPVLRVVDWVERARGRRS